MKKKLFGKKNNLVLDTEEPPKHEDEFLQSNFTKLEGDQLRFLKDNISISSSGITHKVRGLSESSEASGVVDGKVMSSISLNVKKRNNCRISRLER